MKLSDARISCAGHSIPREETRDTRPGASHLRRASTSSGCSTVPSQFDDHAADACRWLKLAVEPLMDRTATGDEQYNDQGRQKGANCARHKGLLKTKPTGSGWNQLHAIEQDSAR